MTTRVNILSSLLVFVIASAIVLRLPEFGVDSELTLALVGIGLSIALVSATVMLVHESRLSREAQSAPYVSVTVRPWKEANTLVELCIENHGRGSARDIQFTLHGDLKMRGGSPLSSLRTFQYGMKYLEPGGIYVSLIGGPDFLKENGRPDQEDDIAVRVVATYLGPSGKRYENESWMEARETVWPTSPIKAIENSMKRMEGILKKVVTA